MPQNAYLKINRTIRENISGQDFFGVFPGNPADGESKLMASLNRVLKNKTTDNIEVIKYDLPKPASEVAGFVVKYWCPCRAPILDEFNPNFAIELFMPVYLNFGK